VLPLV